MTVSAPAAVGHVIQEYKRYLLTSFRFLNPTSGSSWPLPRSDPLAGDWRCDGRGTGRVPIGTRRRRSHGWRAFRTFDL